MSRCNEGAAGGRNGVISTLQGLFYLRRKNQVKAFDDGIQEIRPPTGSADMKVSDHG